MAASLDNTKRKKSENCRVNILKHKRRAIKQLVQSIMMCQCVNSSLEISENSLNIQIGILENHMSITYCISMALI